MTLNQFIYKATRPLGGLQLARILARHHPRILMYHRLSAKDEPGKIHVDQFRKQMRLIKRHFHPMNLTELLEAHEQGSVPNHAVVVTFDDGYADFAEYAFPIMQEEGIPSTLFITTGFVNGDLWLWPDQLRYVIEKCETEDPVNIPGFDKQLDILSDRTKAWSIVADHCLTIPNRQKLQLIEALFKSFNISFPGKAPENYKPLSWLQIREMCSEGLDVGSHSFSHPILTSLDLGELEDELSKSKQLIRKNLGFDTAMFCYPNGQRYDFDDKIKKEIKRAGYRFGIAAFPEAYPLSDIWEIKRYPVSSGQDSFYKSLFGFSYLGSVLK